jgi:LAO/AO transport system kinase
LLCEAIVAGDRTALSRAITYAESTKPSHRRLAEDAVELALPHAGDSLRVGITGVPGVGKSTLIEALGMWLIEQGHRVAVLAVDPSSERTGGSILGDKTRMNALSAHPDAFVRPSPTSGTLGGVARATREAITLVEAAGFDVVLVETVGVGQSETAVHALVDCFVLLALAGAGDELQGMKRGIMEMADVIAVTKADASGRRAAEELQAQLLRSVRLLPSADAGWKTPVVLTSAVENAGLERLWSSVEKYAARARETGRFESRRSEQSTYWLARALDHELRFAFDASEVASGGLPSARARVAGGTASPFAEARRLIRSFLDSAR